MLPEFWIGDLEWNNKFLYNVHIGNNQFEERAKECSYKEFIDMAKSKDLDIVAVDPSKSKKKVATKRIKKDEPIKPTNATTSFDDIPF